MALRGADLRSRLHEPGSYDRGSRLRDQGSPVFGTQLERHRDDQAESQGYSQQALGGLGLATLGTAIATGELRGLLATALMLIGVKMKAGLEEAFMMEQFGAEYAQYKREVRAIIPFLW